jgi:UDP-arabinose 4-epimerase
MNQKFILVTGGAGYIGSHTCKALHQAGFQPIVYDNLSTGHKELVQWGPLIVGDLLDQYQLEKTLLQYQPKAILHFAASAIVSESMNNPALYYENNVRGSLSLLLAMKNTEIPHLIFSSTCATYGNAQSLPMSESHPQLPLSPYGRSKLMIEQMIFDFEKAYGIKSAILRYFNAAGADLEGTIGENHTVETHLIPSLIQTMLGLKDFVSIYGNDFPSFDGTAIRDYIHVTDLANAHALALQRLLSEAPSFAVNLGTGSGT